MTDETRELLAEKRPVCITRREAVELGADALRSWNDCLDDAVVVSASGIFDYGNVVREVALEEPCLRCSRRREVIEGAICIVGVITIAALVVWALALGAWWLR